MDTTILNLVKEFLKQDFIKKISLTKKVDEYIDLSDLSGDDVAVAYNEVKEFNPHFGIYCEDYSYTVSGQNVIPVIYYEKVVELTDKEIFKKINTYIDTNIFTFVYKRVPENYKRVGVDTSLVDKKLFLTLYSTLYRNDEIEKIAEKLAYYYKIV